MRKVALYMMSYGTSFYRYRYIMLYEKVSYNNIKVRRNIKKRYIKKAWQQAKAERQRIKAMRFAHRYGVTSTLKDYSDACKYYSGAQVNFIIFDEV